MPREAALEKQDVLDALAHFRDQGVSQPGQLRLLRYFRDTGTPCSQPVLKQLLDAIRQDALQQDQQVALRERVPQNVSQSAKQLFEAVETQFTALREELLAEAHQLVDEAEAKWQDAQFALSEQVQLSEQAQRQCRQLQEALAEHEEELAELQYTQETERQAHHATQTALAAAHLHLQTAQEHVADLRKQLATQAQAYAQRETHLMNETEALKAEHVRQIRSQANDKKTLEADLQQAKRDLTAKETYYTAIIAEKSDAVRQLHEEKMLVQGQLVGLEKQVTTLKALDKLVSAVTQIQSSLSGAEQVRVALQEMQEVVSALPAQIETRIHEQLESLRGNDEKQ